MFQIDRSICGKVAAVVAVAVLGLAAPVQADDSAAEAGVGVASTAATLVYGPVKVVYSLMGVIFGGFAYGLSGGDSDVMEAVITPAIRGDYVITPSHIRGEKKVEFIGRRPGYRDTYPEEAVVMEDTIGDGY